ncbi:hypothetical protein TNCV_3381001 [Trichonephila clavipes]|nr:hypothetical protein TNCV_3381001 [Trichonephila clavipes]
MPSSLHREFESRVRLGCISFGKEVGLSPEMDSRLERKSSAPHLVICWDHRNLYSSVVVLYVSVHLSHVFRMYPSNKHTTTTTASVVDDAAVGHPGEGMDVCKCIVPLRHEGTLNSRRAASPHGRLLTT